MRSFRHFLLRWFLLSTLVVGLVAPSRAGSSADAKCGVDRYGESAIRELATRLNNELDGRKVNVAIIARAGRPRAQLPRGIDYTHVAIVVFEPVRGADGKPFYTYTVYNLYQGDKGHETTSTLKQDLTYDFVAGIVEPDVAVCVPVDALQRRILQVIHSPVYAALHNPEYNLVANPFVDRYDNCVTDTLKVCVAAIYHTGDRARIYQDIREYFHPTSIHLGLLQALGSNFIPAVRHDDEAPCGLQTATYGSLEAFLASNGLVKDTFLVKVAGAPRI